MWQRAHIFQHPSQETASGHLMGTCQATASRRWEGKGRNFSSQQGSREIGRVREEGRVAGRKAAPPADEHPAVKPLSLPILEPG